MKERPLREIYWPDQSARPLILYGYSLCVIHPEGDYRTLGTLPGVTVLGGEEPLPSPRALVP